MSSVCEQRKCICVNEMRVALTTLDFGRSLRGWKVVYDREACDPSVLEVIREFAGSGSPSSDWIRLSSSQNAKVWKFETRNGWYILKEYLGKGFFDDMKTLVRGSRAKKAWERGRDLSVKGFDTPRGIAFGECVSFLLPSRSFLVAEFLQDSPGVYTLLKEEFGVPLSRERVRIKRSLFRELGRFVGRLHAEGIVHGDLRLDNIIVHRWRSDSPGFFLIDNERNRHFSGVIPDRLRLKNLVQVNMLLLVQVTFSDRLRFFKAYLEENPGLGPVRKEWMRRILLKTQKRLQKKFSRIWTDR
jgi:tRNA A-37 threonylcarbamoyl transferase component Bud32